MATAYRENPPSAPAAGASAAPGASVASGATLADEEPTIGRLVADASRDVSTLIQNEIALAKSELRVSIKAGGTGAGLFAAAGFLALLAIVMVSIAFAFLISMTGLHLAWCFLIVFAAYMLLAALLAFVGYKKVKKVRAPERAIHQAQETKQLLKRG